MTIQLSWYDPEKTILYVRYSGIITRTDLEKMWQDKLDMQNYRNGDYYVIDDVTRVTAVKDLQNLVNSCQSHEVTSLEEGHFIIAATGMIETLIRSTLHILGRSRPDLAGKAQIVETFERALQKISRFRQAKR